MNKIESVAKWLHSTYLASLTHEDRVRAKKWDDMGSFLDAGSGE